MRLLFLFLLLVNGLIYSWYSFYSESAHATAVVEIPNAPELVLLSEQSLSAQAADNETANDVDLSAVAIQGKTDRTSKICFTLGPFMNEGGLADATRGLMMAGRPFEKRVSKKKELMGYWVLIPPLQTEADAYAKVQALKQAGDKHHYVVKDPLIGINAVSLGVFREKQNAERRLQQIEKLGHEVKVQARYRQDPVYWLDFTELKGAQALDITQFVGAQRLPRACEEIASTDTVP